MPVTLLHCGAPSETVDSLSVEQLRGGNDPIDNEAIARQVIDALSMPIGLPPLPQCLTPEDRIAIAVSHATPTPMPLVVGAVAALVAAGIEHAKMTVVVTNPRDMKALEAGLSEVIAAGVQIETHDPLNDDGLCFAGLASGDRPLLLNRTVFEADFVLPISAEANTPLSGADVAGSPFDGLFPDFFDQHTIDRVGENQPDSGSQGGSKKQKQPVQTEAEQAGWLIGAPLMLRAIHAPGGGVAKVMAGEPEQVAKDSIAVCQQAWQTPLAEPAQIVLAILSGSAAEQTWSSVGKALETAERLVAHDGVLAIWSELSEPISQQLARLADVGERDTFSAELASESSDEALTVRRILQALERGPVFFHSQLEPDEVESLGFAPVENATEMVKLVNRFPSATVLEEAQHITFAPPAELHSSESPTNEIGR